MRIFRPCFIAGWVYPEAIFRIDTNEKVLCLTFDDGPDPSTTPVLIDILGRYNIKAHFFCSGNASEKYPELVSLILSKGHLTGNHGFSHPDGWRSSTDSYCNDIEKAAGYTSGVWFRPPFGRLRLSQYRRLIKRYKIVFWDILPYDFDKSFSDEDSLKVLYRKLRPGSVIVLHDSQSSSVSAFLGQFIESAINSGYRFVQLK